MVKQKEVTNRVEQFLLERAGQYVALAVIAEYLNPDYKDYRDIQLMRAITDLKASGRIVDNGQHRYKIVQ